MNHAPIHPDDIASLDIILIPAEIAALNRGAEFELSRPIEIAEPVKLSRRRAMRVQRKFGRRPR